jgi:PmbA protein
MQIKSDLNSKAKSIVNPIDQTDWQSLAADMLAEAQLQGATAAAVDASVSTGLSVTVRLGEVETVEHHRNKGVSIIVYFGQRMGSASTSDTCPDAIRNAVWAACRIAKMTEEDACAGLANGNLMAYDSPDLDLYHPKTFSVEQAIEMARTCEAVAREQDKRITNSDGATIATHQGYSVYANTHGFNGAYAGTSYSLNCALISQQGDDMERDGSYTVGLAIDDLWTPAEVARDAARRTVSRLGAQRLTTRQSPIIFEAPIAKGLLSHLINAISGGSLYRKASFLLNKLGQPIFPEFVHIHEQPHLLRGLGSAPFDAEGVATRAKDFIRAGVLESYVLGSYSARKLGMHTTGNSGGVTNLSIDTSNYGLTELMKQMGTGLLVTDVMGQGINLVTGDYSRGASGFWIENGEIQYPVHEITIAGNLRDMFAHMIAVGNDVDRRGNIQTGSILLENMTIAGM